MTPILKVSHLTKIFEPSKKNGAPFVAVDRISFDMRPGEILGLLGPNGAGKSTTISMLLGVSTPTSGSIHYFDKSLKTHRSEILQNVTFASTYIKLPWRLTILENLRVYAYMYGLSEGTFQKRAQKLLDFFGVWHHRHKTINDVSAGQITRIMLVKAFLPHPKIVLLDEPTASLDPDIAHQVRDFVKQQQQQYQTTILYTSHNMDEVSNVCDRVIFLRKGKIIATDTPQKLASSVSMARMRLVLVDGLKRLQQLCQNLHYPTILDGREIEIEIDEFAIANFLRQLGKQDIHYSQISIAKPTLEDYFLSMS